MVKHILFFFVLILLGIFIIFIFNKNDRFTEIIKLESDFYIPKKDKIIDFSDKSINAHRICIFDDTDPSNVDIECIDANELITVLDLPNQRKREVCIDDVCLTKDDIRVLNGSKGFKIKSKDLENDNMFDKCLNNGETKSHICGEFDFVNPQVNIYTLKPGNCDLENDYVQFVMRPGLNKDSDLHRIDKIQKAVRMQNNKEESHH
jgi:hypothetical protein